MFSYNIILIIFYITFLLLFPNFLIITPLSPFLTIAFKHTQAHISFEKNLRFFMLFLHYLKFNDPYFLLNLLINSAQF